MRSRLPFAAVLATLLSAPSAASAQSPAATPQRVAQALSPFPNATVTLSRPPPQTPFAASLFPPPKECPPCNPFNCVLPAFTCLNNGECNDYNGQCVCPPGFGGEDCSKPLCGSLADGPDRFPREGDTCECDDGWGGLNCNVCQSDKACEGFVLRDPTLGLRPGNDEVEAVCYQQGFAVHEVFQMCDVTNRKILDMLPNRPPQVTFTCDVPSETCGFQFWIGKVESFYCGLSNCTSTFDVGFDSNYTEVNCQQMECACIPGKMLCGEDGSVDISDFLTEEISGPAKFSSRSGEATKFEEPAMNALINDIFADAYITLQCKSGECMSPLDVPGFVLPPKPNDKRWVIVSGVLVATLLVAALVAFWFFGRSGGDVELSFLGGRIRLPANGSAKDAKLEEHIPTALQFSNLTYALPNGRIVLESITGSVQPGEIMAVIGASGAGKSTFLDLLAKKAKKGSISGEILVNGEQVADAEYRRVVGFVDQEDTLMGTLTVYETILCSALLRLPRDMSYAEKKMRVLETMHELGILGIRDSRIGESGHRSISGGEKRRVSIACELVTSPSILFLDEPTSGLDSFNAFNVVEALVQLSHTHKRTVVFTIHQPRSNIVALFDKIILLASGKLVYSGKAAECHGYFAGIGSVCPTGYNIADYLIDLTMQSDAPSPPAEAEAALIQLDGEQDAVAVSDPELGVGSRPSRIISSSSNGDATPTSQDAFSRLFGSGRSTPTQASLPPRLASLVEAYASSDVARDTKAEIEQATALARANGRVEGAAVVLRAYKRAGWWTQFTILSGRSFKNLYRNPLLMLSHYAVAVVVAGICAFLFRGLTDDIPGFQNRMGLIFFVLSIFGFSCLSTISAFATERLLFTRERANGYYSPAAYFASKLLFDIIPLRVLPPLVFGAIVYTPVGLVPQIDSFWQFVLVLVLFNLTASSVVLFLSVVVKNAGVANLIGTLVMLFNLLFAGLLINRDKLPWFLQWMETGSFFHAAFEALLVNEVRYLQLKDHRYGVDIEVPAATILSMFGFNAQAFWFPDVTLLVALFVAFTAASFVALVILVKEKR